MQLQKKYSNIPKDIIQKMKQANVFFTKEYSDYADSSGQYMWYVYDEQFIIPVKIMEKLKIKQGLYVSEPFMLVDKYSKKIVTSFLEASSELLKKEGVAFVSTSASALFDSYPQNSLRIPFGSHIIDLTLTEEEILMGMHSKHRNSVRRAERNGVNIISGGKELISDYLKVDAETWERSGRNSYGETFFSVILDSLGNNATLYVAYKDCEPQAGACYFFNKKMSYYMYGASITNPEPGAANLLQWVAIRNMKAFGVEKFSFVGCRINEDENSKYHGIQRYKERFGGELNRGFMFKVILNPIKYYLFRFFYKIKKGRKLTDAIDEEIYKWPDLQRITVED